MFEWRFADGPAKGKRFRRVECPDVIWVSNRLSRRVLTTVRPDQPFLEATYVLGQQEDRFDGDCDAVYFVERDA
jgi:hypothetical protein